MREEMPQAEPGGFVKTLNNMGYMTSGLDPYSQAFVDFASKGPGPALDIGAAYGVAALAALEAGAAVYANDIEPRHLRILEQRASAMDRPRLTILPGVFPDGLTFCPGSFGSILVARVLHFFDGPMIERSAEKLFEWLSAGGKVFVVAETPYLRNFKAFIPVYERRRRSGEPWPGMVDDVMAFSPGRGKSLPPRIHFLDPEILARVFLRAGFRIEKAATMPRPDFPPDLQFDGRESVGVIAEKPR